MGGACKDKIPYCVCFEKRASVRAWRFLFVTFFSLFVSIKLLGGRTGGLDEVGCYVCCLRVMKGRNTLLLLFTYLSRSFLLSVLYPIELEDSSVVSM